MKSKEKILLIPKNILEKDLPHTEDKLFIDEITIANGILRGFLTVRNEHCRNHKIGEKLIMRGVDFGEMAFQLLAGGIIHLPEYSYLKGRVGMARGISMTFSKPAYPGTHIIMEMIISEIIVKPGNAKKTNMIKGGRTIARGVDDAIKATIDYIKLAILKPNLIEAPNDLMEEHND